MIVHSEYLDLVLVPGGLLVMLVYHLYLVYRYIKFPKSTAIGLENHDKRAWVSRLRLVDKKSSIEVLRNNLTGATFLASVTLTLSSLIGAWISSSSSKVFRGGLILGNTSSSTLSIKYMSLLSCFLLGFSCFAQAANSYVRVQYLVCMPNKDIPFTHVERLVTRGGLFWILGLRALYVALNLLLWFFGPIPMFASSVITVAVLYLQDINTVEPYPYGTTPTPSPVEISTTRQTSLRV